MFHHSGLLNGNVMLSGQPSFAICAPRDTHKTKRRRSRHHHILALCISTQICLNGDVLASLRQNRGRPPIAGTGGETEEAVWPDEIEAALALMTKLSAAHYQLLSGEDGMGSVHTHKTTVQLQGWRY